MIIRSILSIIASLVVSTVWGNKLTQPISTEEGPIQGGVHIYNNETVIYRFLGVPYAKPPIGKLRFLRPERLTWRKSILKAIKPGANCMQKAKGKSGQRFSEDCLYLNIIVQKKAIDDRKLRPVLIYIHDGLLQKSSGSHFPLLNDFLVLQEDIILVTLNYRLNLFGFIFDYRNQDQFPGNLGLWDQNFAISWIKRNIHFFGGNPDKITLMGEGAGGQSVWAHIVSPFSKNLFKKAIIISALDMYLQNNFNARTALSTELIQRSTNCKLASDPLRCLQSIDGDSLLQLMPKMIAPFYMVFESEFLPFKSNNILLDRLNPPNDIDLLIGITNHDGAVAFEKIFPEVVWDPKLDVNDTKALIKLIYKRTAVNKIFNWYIGKHNYHTSKQFKQALIKLFTDIFTGCQSWEHSRRLMRYQKKGQTFAFMLSNTPNTPTALSTCNLDERFDFCHDDSKMYNFGLPFTDTRFTDEDKKMSKQMMKIIASFARFG